MLLLRGGELTAVVPLSSLGACPRATHAGRDMLPGMHIIRGLRVRG